MVLTRVRGNVIKSLNRGGIIAVFRVNWGGGEGKKDRARFLKSFQPSGTRQYGRLFSGWQGGV